MGINRIFSRFTIHKGRILAYHGVTKKAPTVSNWQQIRVDEFIQQMAYLKKYYNVVPLTTMLEYLFYKKQIPNRCVALTFDDGYENNFSVVYPLLRELNLPATFFISTAFVENGNKSLWFDQVYEGIADYSDRNIDLSLCGFGILNTSTISAKSHVINLLCEQLKSLSHREMQARLEYILEKVSMKIGENILFPGMSCEQIRILAADPLITIGGHSHTHFVLSKLSEEEAWKEIIINKEFLEKNIGKPMTIFSYPNGNWNSEIVSLLRRAGYEFALTTEENFVTSKPYAVERMTVRNPSTIHLFEALVSGFIPMMKRYLRFLKR